jgi:hypothetical protein
MLFLILALAAVVILVAEPALAQCAMCKQAVASSEEAQRLSKTMNFAILVLLLPPVAIFVGIFGVFYRSRNAHRRDEIE